MISFNEAAATYAHSADKRLSSASYIKNDCSRCKLADQLPSSAECIKNESSRLNLIRESKPSETPPIEDSPSTNDALIQVIKEKNKIGWEWSILNSALDSWDARYEELVIYKREFGNARVPQKFARNPALGNWVHKHKSDYKNFQLGIASFSLTGDKIQLLSKIGFEWNTLDSWDTRYEELVSYVKEFGNTRVPRRFAENPALGHWVANQRIKYKKCQNENTLHIITKEQIRLLESIRFEWSIPHSVLDTWDARYEELVIYVKEFGNAQVPQKFAKNPALGNWVNKQRRDYKKFQPGIACRGLTGDKIRLLNKIGFEWNKLRGIRDTKNL